MALSLQDVVNDQNIAEWFYILVCSNKYAHHPFRDGPLPNKKYTVIQKEFDLEAIRPIVKQRLTEFKAENWDDFYHEMEQRFLHED